MIPYDFLYCRPYTLEEAREAFLSLQADGKNPVYYAGGSETITMSRAGSIKPGAVIDIKAIPCCMLLSKDNEGLNIGSNCTLNQIKESRLFPLLALTCGRIADHTNQCRITLGGNLCGTIRYRETSLPMLLSDATITLYGKKGLYTVPFQSVFTSRMQLNPSEMIVQLHVPNWALQAPYFHVKRTANEKIDYPLVSMAAMIVNSNLRIAFSGICANPFRSLPMEAILNDRSLFYGERVEKAVKLLPEQALHDNKGSGEYRLFVLKNMLQSLLEDFRDGQV
jgi:CO/xanthine dehydrogenase FAD-binding subunit